jgi:hypothetical protein
LAVASRRAAPTPTSLRRTGRSSCRRVRVEVVGAACGGGSGWSRRFGWRSTSGTFSRGAPGDGSQRYFPQTGSLTSNLRPPSISGPRWWQEAGACARAGAARCGRHRAKSGPGPGILVSGQGGRRSVGFGCFWSFLFRIAWLFRSVSVFLRFCGSVSVDRTLAAISHTFLWRFALAGLRGPRVAKKHELATAGGAKRVSNRSSSWPTTPNPRSYPRTNFTSLSAAVIKNYF